MAFPLAMVFDLIAVDKASPVFNRVATAAAGAGTATEKAMLRINRAGTRMGAAGSLLSRKLTLPLLAIGAASVKAATDFNSSMTRIQTQAGASAKDVSYLTKAVLNMKGAQQGPNELASALYHLKSVGLDNVGAMKALRVGSDLAAVGNASLEDTVNALAGAWRTGIKGAKDFHDAAATINAVIGAGNMTLPDLTGALGTGILPSAKTFGLTLKDVGSALALFTDEGVPADAAATRLRMTFSLLGAPTEKASKLLQGIGISGLQLANDMRKPDGLITAIGDLKSHLEDPKLKLSLSEQAALLSRAFGGGRSSSAILSLINNFDVLKQKQDQVTRSLGKYDAAVAAQKATPQAQFKTALASLEKAGVLLGNQLLPIATQFAHVLASVASGFNGMSSGAKKFAAEVGVGLLVLGPMLSLVGKLTKAIAFMWAAGVASSRFIAGTRAATLSMDAMSSKAYLAGRSIRGWGTAAKTAGAALSGAAIGASIGLITRNASGAEKAVGALASTLTGALVGSAFGPLGAVIGGATGLLGDLASAFGLGGGGASAAAAEMSANVESLTAALQRDNLAVGATTKAWIAHKIATSGVLALQDKLGASYQLITQAALGNKNALGQIQHAWDSLSQTQKELAGGSTKDLIGTLGNLGISLGKAKDEAWKENNVQVALGQAHRDSARSASRNADALGNLAAGSHDVVAGSHAASGAMHAATGAAVNLGQSVKKLTKDLLGYASAALGLAQSQDQFQESVRGLSQQLKGTHDQLNITTKAGLANRDAFINAATGALSLRDSQRKAGATIGQANRKLLENIVQLRATAIAGGATASSVDHLLGRYHLLPSQIKTLISANTAQAEAKLYSLTGKINGLVNGYHQVTISVVENDIRHGNTVGPVKKALGGIVRGRGTGTSDSISARLSNGEFVVRAAQTAKHRGLLENLNKGIGGFARGGQVGVSMPSPRLSSSGGVQRSTTSRVVSGTLGIDADSQGRLFAMMRDVVIEESDLGGTIGRMR